MLGLVEGSILLLELSRHHAALRLGQGTQRQTERVLVAIAQVRGMVNDIGQAQFAGSQAFQDRGMGRMERQEPVAQGFEEGEGLQVGKCGDEHIAALELHGVELFDAVGDTALFQPLLPIGIGLDIAQVYHL